MSKVSVEKKKGQIRITNKLTYPETVNERIYKEILSGKIEGFLPVTVCKKRRETKISCEPQEVITLKEFFDDVVPREKFLNVVYQIVQLIKICDENMINANNLDLQCDRVFVDPHTEKIRCIYWPIVNNKCENSPQLFFKQLPFVFENNLQAGAHYLELYNLFFAEVVPFSVKSFEKLILNLQGNYEFQRSKRPYDAFEKDNRKYCRVGQDSDLKNIEYDPFATQENFCLNEIDGTICPYCRTMNPRNFVYCKKCNSVLNCKNEHKESSSLQGLSFEPIVLGDDLTESEGCEPQNVKVRVFPILVRVATDDVFEINKSVFKIGTEQEENDLPICDNRYISRRHADIIARGERYYLVDRQSTNKSFVNNVVVSPGKETEIFTGTKIHFANEEFIFIKE